LKVLFALTSDGYVLAVDILEFFVDSLKDKGVGVLPVAAVFLVGS
jgi:hypothetical protein